MATCVWVSARACPACSTPALTDLVIALADPLHHPENTLYDHVLGLEHLVPESLIGRAMHALRSARGQHGLEHGLGLATKPGPDLVGPATRPVEAVLALGRVGQVRAVATEEVPACSIELHHWPGEHANPWGLAPDRVRLRAHGKRMGWCRSWYGV